MNHNTTELNGSELLFTIEFPFLCSFYVSDLLAEDTFPLKNGVRIVLFEIQVL